MMVIRWKDIFERLEDAIDSTETAVNIMAGIIIKNRYVHSDVVLWIVVGTALGVRLHQRVPRHRELDRDLGVDARDVAAGGRRRWPPSLNFVGAFLSLAVAATIANGHRRRRRRSRC